MCCAPGFLGGPRLLKRDLVRRARPAAARTAHGLRSRRLPPDRRATRPRGFHHRFWCLSFVARLGASLDTRLVNSLLGSFLGGQAASRHSLRRRVRMYSVRRHLRQRRACDRASALPLAPRLSSGLSWSGVLDSVPDPSGSADTAGPSSGAPDGALHSPKLDTPVDGATTETPDRATSNATNKPDGPPPRGANAYGCS